MKPESASQTPGNDTLNQDVRDLLNEWGWSFPPAPVVENARLSVSIRKMRVGDALVEMGLMDEDAKETLMAEKPTDRQTLDWLAIRKPELRSFVDKVLALQEGVQYFDNLGKCGLAAHPIIRQEQVREWCEKRGCAVLMMERITPVLCFGSWTDLVRHRQEGSRSRNPLISELDGETPILAVCDPGQIANIRAAASGGTLDLMEADQTNLWIPTQTRDSKALSRVADLLDAALTLGVTDVALVPLRDGQGRVRFRIDGWLTDPPGGPQILPIDHWVEINRFLAQRSGANPNAVKVRSPAEGQIVYRSSVGEAFIRTSFIPLDPAGTTYDMLSGSLRILPRKEGEISLENLNIPNDIIQVCANIIARSQGLILVCGPTNCGKSTTLAGLRELYRKRFLAGKKCIAIEDPTERFLLDVLHISLPRGMPDGFADYFKAVLRHDPDMVILGEVRDGDTADVAVRAATSGHIVLSSLHANDTILGLRTIANMIQANKWFDLFEAISLLIGQRLVRRICPDCRGKWRNLTDLEINDFQYYNDSQALHLSQPGRVRDKGKGCETCGKSGYRGVLPIVEVMEVTRPVRDLLHSERYSYEDLGQHRMQTLAASALSLVNAGEVSLDAVFV